ncbi:LuxR family transcriptional regulator [Streptomyces sp. NPDC050738]|uniref:helix-turn-helix transcriptional regulator n=1 Tax=Streptomyces sp. NPDC050738 TaxID=3154744 RepID=UPI00341E4636
MTPEGSTSALHEGGRTGLWPAFDTHLRAGLEALEHHHGVLVDGVWGSGRTTLLRALAHTLAGQGASVIRLSPGPGDERRAMSGLAHMLATLPRNLPASLHPAQQSVLHHVMQGDLAPAFPHDVLAVRLATTALLASDDDTRWLLAVDDAQWLDAASADVVQHLAGALAPGRFRTAVTVRTAHQPASGHRAMTEHAPRIGIGMLTLEETVHYLESMGERAATAVPVHRDSGGHPLLVQALAAPPTPDAPGRTARELAASWLATVDEEVRETLALLALAHDPTRLQVRRTWPDRTDAHLAAALEAGILKPLAGDRIVFAARALQSEAAGSGTAFRIAAAHRALAGTTPDPVRAARHQLLGEDRPSPDVLDRADEAAAQARAGGDRALAADILLAAAARTSNGQRPTRLRRLVAAAEDAGAAGRADLALRAADALSATRAGAAEAVALLAVVDASGQELADLDQLLLRARRLARGDAALLAAVDMRSAIRHNLGGRPGEARQAALSAVREASTARLPALKAAALTMQARIERITAHPGAGRTLQLALAVPQSGLPLPLRDTPQYLAVRHALFDDRLDEARTALTGLLPLAEASGSAEDLQEILRSLAELEIRSGNCARALQWSERALSVGRAAGLSLGPAWYTCAMTAMAGSSFDEAARFARLGVLVSREARDLVFTSRNLLALGTVELVTGEPGRAAANLGKVADLEQLQHVRDVTMLRWQPERVEALAATGQQEPAAHLLNALRRTASAQALATGWGAGLDRSEAVLLAHLNRRQEAVVLLERAGEHFHELGLRLEEGRTHLTRGRIERGRRRGAAARSAGERAMTLFEDAGARPWTALVHTFLYAAEEIGAPQGGPAALTVTERRVADVVISGASNKEAAQRLFLSVKTVEATLSRVYRKLDVRSRSQLAAVLRPA